MSNTSELVTFRWKGKIVTKKLYEKRLAQQQSGLRRKKMNLTSIENRSETDSERNGSIDQEPIGTDDRQIEPVEEKHQESIDAEGNQIESVDEDQESIHMDGRRIVELKLLGKQMWCTSCKQALSLEYIENEIRRGLGSELLVRCHNCLIINQVYTSKQRGSKDKRRVRFDTNYKVVLGMLHSGLGWSHLSKICACLNIPCMDSKTFKKYETEIGLAAEKVAKSSCADAAALERRLTLEQVETITKLLPEEIETDFFIPTKETGKTLQESEGESIASVSFNDVVRILVPYDMGWSTRGAGRNYDSLNGFGAIIGHFSGLVLDYSTCNRKCRTCESSDDPPKHDCRKNFYGSAKAMEPHVAKKLVVESDILQSKNVEVGVLIGDDDSSTIAVCRSASNHPIIKQSDINHTSGGVKKQLYSIQKSHQELTKDRITYLHRCFMYAVAQNRGNSEAMANAIRSIPSHTFNDHSQCGNWCGYIRDKDNYDHKVIPGGFQDDKLFTGLEDIFKKLAANAQKFSSGASSNSNESLNATTMSKHPKSRCYSRTASADFRYACAIGQKNLGEKYTQRILQTISLSPGKHHSRHVSRTQKALSRRRKLMKTIQFKNRRNELKKCRGSLRYRKENIEGVTYKSHCSLLSEPAIQTEDHVSCPGFDNDSNEHPIVLFDLETSGLDKNCDILQIAAKYNRSSFNIYINPTKQISANATAANGLINYQGDLMYHGIKVKSVPLQSALIQFLEWLKFINKKYYLAAHNLSFDGPRLYRGIYQYSLIDEFSNVICGFIDTLGAIRKITNRRGRGACSISGLCSALNINSTGAHNAIQDCNILSQILYKLNITNSILIKTAHTYFEKMSYWRNEELASQNLLTLSPLQSTISIGIRKKLALMGFTMHVLREVYNEFGRDGLHKHIQTKLKIEGSRGIRSSSIDQILDWFAKEYE